MRISATRSQFGVKELIINFIKKNFKNQEKRPGQCYIECKNFLRVSKIWKCLLYGWKIKLVKCFLSVVLGRKDRSYHDTVLCRAWSEKQVTLTSLKRRLKMSRSRGAWLTWREENCHQLTTWLAFGTRAFQECSLEEVTYHSKSFTLRRQDRHLSNRRLSWRYRRMFTRQAYVVLVYPAFSVIWSLTKLPTRETDFIPVNANTSVISCSVSS
jgi:hypothetical protein